MSEEPLSIDRVEQLLASARGTEPTPAALARLHQIFDPAAARALSVESGQGSFWRAVLGWDSRLQPSTLGVRQADLDSYRLLYSSEQGDIELMIEPQDERRALDGEIVLPDSESADAAALITLQPQPQGPVFETRSNRVGRFSLDGIRPGPYTLLALLIDGRRLEIETLEIT